MQFLQGVDILLTFLLHLCTYVITEKDDPSIPKSMGPYHCWTYDKFLILTCIRRNGNFFGIPGPAKIHKISAKNCWMIEESIPSK